MIDKIIDWLAQIVAFIFFILILGALGTLILVPGYLAEKKSCKEISKIFNYKYEYTLFTGCILEKPNGNKFLLKKLYSVENK